MNNCHFTKIDKIAQTSKLNQVNAGIKILIGIISLIFCILTSNIVNYGFIFLVMFFIIVFLAKIEFKMYLHLLRVPIFFLTLSMIAILVNISSVKLGYLDINIGFVYLSITRSSILQAIKITMRSFGAVSCLYMISLTTPLVEIIEILYKIKVPEIIVELMYLILRYLIILLEVHNHMYLSACSRLGYESYKNSFFSMVKIGSNLLLNSFKKASLSYDAMVSRGYTGRITFFSEKKPIRKKECMISGIYFLILFVLQMYTLI